MKYNGKIDLFRGEYRLNSYEFKMGRNQNKDTNDLILELTAETKKNLEDLNKIISQQRTDIKKLTKILELE